MMVTQGYHIPVLLQDCIDGLIQDKSGVFVDVTFGGGGHSQAILEELAPEGRLFAFDRDADVLGHLPEDERFELFHHDFRYMSNHLRLAGYPEVDGILADLGVSSHQFDTPDRGFSIRFDGPLDMRMDQDAELQAVDIIEAYSEEELYRVFREGADLKGLGRLVRRILEGRGQGHATTRSFIEWLEPVSPRQGQSKYWAQIFQALRIEVNQEMASLKALLTQAEKVIKPGGRLVVMSYHSLEDRMVKQFIRSGNTQGKVETDIFGKVQRPFKEVNRKVIMPTEEEVEQNPRSRSAKLRIAERL